MTHKSTYKLLFKRRRSGKTNYAKRLALLKSHQPRLVVRKSNNLMKLQIVQYSEKGNSTVVSSSSQELGGFNWKSNLGNVPSAYLAGFLLGKRAVAAGIKTAVLDIGLHTPMHKGRIFSAVKGVLDAGLTVPVGEDALPDEKRVSGKHIEAFAQKLDGEKAKKQFSKEMQNGFDPKKISESFTQVKSAIEKDPAKKTVKTKK